MIRLFGFFSNTNMNDHHLDPPDTPEPPEWYCMIESALDESDCPEDICVSVRKILDDWCQSYNEERDPDPPSDDYEFQNVCTTCGKPTECMFCSEECAPDCRHGNRPGNCDACDHEGDIAYDAARESRR